MDGHADTCFGLPNAGIAPCFRERQASCADGSRPARTRSAVTCYRLSSRRFPANSGTGAALHGGRRNPAGTEVIYAAANRSLAAIEILVHFSVLPKDFVITANEIPDRLLVESISPASLPPGWNDPGDPLDRTRRLGSEWIVNGVSAGLGVPSAVVADEWIYVINVNHPQFGEITFGTPEPFTFDPRLKGTEDHQ